MKGKLKIVYAITPKFQKEYGKIMRRKLLEYMESGKAARFSNEKIDEEISNLGRLKTIRSNDKHIIALARISKSKLLVTEDKDLIDDFKDRDIVGGHIYKGKRHSRLLAQNVCPT